MSANGPLPFLELNGLEIANTARTYEYIRNGLGTPNHHAGPGELCSVLYRQNGGTCGAPDTYDRPSTDPAPWYDALRPESADFLGLWLIDIGGYDSPIQRTVATRASGLGGGTFSAERNTPREWKFTGYLFSNSDEGAEYGFEWLTYALSSVGSGVGCSGCSVSQMRVFLSCPPDNCSDDTIGEWYAYEAALTLGPKEVQDNLTCRDAVLVEFTITCGNPYLYKVPAGCLPPEIVGAVMPPIYDFCYWLTGVAG